jgi:hypothetical protein
MEIDPVRGHCRRVLLIILEALFGKFVPTWTKTYAHFAIFGVLQLIGA